MECILQYLDDLDDLFYAAALSWERFRRICRFALILLTSLAVQALGVYLALYAPPLAVATVSILFVVLLYRSVVYHSPVARPARS
jgi:hypothetical protein